MTRAPEGSTLAQRVRGWLSLELLDNRYPALHGLRVLAILSVVQFHVSTIFALEQGIALDFDFLGGSLTVFFGMDLFFLLSGFLIGSILLRSLETTGTQQLWRFYVRRVFRTFPSYYVVLTALALGTTLTAWQRQNLPYEYLYLTNFRSLARPHIVMFWGWSLALEEQFYLTVPLLFAVLQRLRSDRGRFVLLFALWSVPLALRLYIYFKYRPWNDVLLYSALYFRTKTRFDTLVAGIFLAMIHARYQKELRAWLAEPLHRALLALPAMATFWILLRPELFGAEHTQLFHVFAWGSLTSVMYVSFLVLLLHTDGLLQKMLSAPIFRRIATLGYGVYLVHIPVCDRLLVPLARRLQERHHSMLWVWPFSVAFASAVSLAIAYLLHVLVEKPSLRLRERLAA